MSIVEESEATLRNQCDLDNTSVKLQHGERMFDYRVKRIFWDAQEAFLHVFVDTTSVQELATAHAENKCQRLMMASTTHELRTPLNVA